MHKKIYKKEKKQQLEKKKSFKNFIKNKNYLYIFLILINIVFTIYIAKKNSVHYVKVLNNDVLISNDKLLFLGRGYINLLIIGFFSLYTILIDKFLLKKKITFKSSILIILLYSILDVVLFYLFINKIF